MDESLAKIRHERSKKDFPGLNLDDGEYVEFAFRRSRACLILIFGALFVSLVIILLAFLLSLMGASLLDEMGRNFLFIILSALLVAAILIAAFTIMIYCGNQLFITNKHAIQKIMDSPVSKSINTIDLSSIEDVSYQQKGILPSLFRYGTLRLSTVGDETTYTFKYSDISPEDLKAVTKLVTSAKKPHKPRESRPEETQSTTQPEPTPQSETQPTA